jgi:hypothetical protein
MTKVVDGLLNNRHYDSIQFSVSTVGWFEIWYIQIFNIFNITFGVSDV